MSTTTTVSTSTSTTLPGAADDSDVVLVLPASSEDQKRDMIQLLQPWIDRARPLAVSTVLLSDVGAANASMPTAEEIRQYLRAHFTHRPSTIEHPRYLGLVALPYPQYGAPNTPLELSTIPRFSVQVRDVEAQYAQMQTDVPYGFLLPDTIDGGDGFVEPADLDMQAATFTVFRIPVARTADLTRFVERADQFAAASYRSDVALVAGEFGVIPGDTSLIQCVNATALAQNGGAGQVIKVFDYQSQTCEPEVLTTPGYRLADFLADGSDQFHGGMVYNISHGTSFATFAANGTNLSMSDLDRLAAGELNVFVSIACANDEQASSLNLAMGMYLHNSVAVVSATENLFPVGGGSAIADAEINAFQSLYQAPITLLQGLQQFRASYYEHYVIAGPVEDRPYQWINLLAVHVLGDGLVVVAKTR